MLTVHQSNRVTNINMLLKMGVPLIVYECRWIWILKYKKYESTSVEAFFGTAYHLPVGLSR